MVGNLGGYSTSPRKVACLVHCPRSRLPAQAPDVAPWSATSAARVGADSPVRPPGVHEPAALTVVPEAERVEASETSADEGGRHDPRRPVGIAVEPRTVVDPRTARGEPAARRADDRDR